MRPRLARPGAGLLLALAAGLVALPACNKDKKPTGSDTSPPSPPYGGSKGGPPGGMPMPPGGMPPGVNPGNPPTPPGGNPTQRAIYPTSDARTREQSQNNLKQIALAFHIVHDQAGRLPVGMVDQNNKVGLSWRVAILPYIEQGNLYKQFKLDEPWDSEHNKKLIAVMPKTFAPPGGTDTGGKTYYRSFTGPDAVIPSAPFLTKPGFPAYGRSFATITDGLSNTLLVAEAGEPVIWTKPDELVYEKGKALPRVGGGVFGDGFNAALCDGSVRWFKSSLPPATLEKLINVQDGQVIDLDQ